MNTPDYAELLKSLLVSEFGYSEEDAHNAVKSSPGEVIQGTLAGNASLRGCAMAVDHAWKERERTP